MTKFDYDLFVIGAGSGGVRASRMAAAAGKKVAVAEQEFLGGTCVNVGCVPKKLFSYAAHMHDELRDSAGFGWNIGETSWSWRTLRDNKDKEIERLNGIYGNLLNNAGVELYQARAELVDAHTIKVGEQRVTAQNILIATGGYANVPDVPGKEHIKTSYDAFYLDTFPKRAVVLGGGYIGVEFASIFNGLGAETTLVLRRDMPLRGFDEDVRQFLMQEMTKKGMAFKTGVRFQSVEKIQDEYHVTLDNGDVLVADCVLGALGRTPNTANLGLESVGVELRENHSIVVNEYYQTSVPSIYAIGDVIDKVQLTPVAIKEGMALVQTLCYDNPSSVDYENIPTAVFSHPNVGTVGLTEEAANAEYNNVKIYRSEFRPLKHTVSGSDERCLMKMIVDEDSQRVLGVHIVGFEAGELIQGVAVALKAGATKADFDSTIGVHPTSAEEFVTLR